MISQRLHSPDILDATPYLHAGYRCCAACAFSHLYTSFPNWRREEACAKENTLYPVWSDDIIWKILSQLGSRKGRPFSKFDDLANRLPSPPLMPGGWAISLFQLSVPSMGKPQDTAQINYEVIRPVILWGVTPKERGAETGVSPRAIYYRANLFDQAGMASLLPTEPPLPVPKLDKRSLPPDIRQEIVDLHAQYPAFRPHEIATICFVKFNATRRPSPSSCWCSSSV